MLNIIIIINLLFIIALLLMSLNYLISLKQLKTREKISPFECGFDPISKSRIPFRVQFFLISLIFLIFDVEIILLIPLVYLTQIFNEMYIFISFLFLIILIIGLLIEYWEKSID